MRMKALALALLLALVPFARAEAVFALPAALLDIGEEAFLNVPMEEIRVPEGCASIGARAFAGTGALRALLPNSLSYIAEDAFEGCEGITCVVQRGSYAEDWCRQQGISWCDGITQYRALLIGESEFYNSDGEVRERANRNAGDVQLMQAMLESVTGPDGGSYAGGISAQLNLSVNETRSAIEGALGDADADDVSLFFVATHGDYTSSGASAGALMMSSGGYLRFNQLAGWLSGVPGKVVVVVESCGSGAAIYDESAQSEGGEGEAAAEAGLNALADFNRQLVRAFSAIDDGVIVSPPEGALFSGELRVENKFYVLTASAYQELSWGLSNYNLFTRWLTEGVGTEGEMPADTVDYAGDGNGVATLYELYRYVSIVGDNKKIKPAGSTEYHYQHVQAWPAVRSGSLELFRRAGA